MSRMFKYRKALLLSVVAGLLVSGAAVAATTANAAPVESTVVCGPETRLTAPHSTGDAIAGFGSYKTCFVGDIGIEVTLSEDGTDVAQRRVRCTPANYCDTSVKTSWEPYKKYCVSIFAAFEEPDASLGADKQTRCERFDGNGDRLGDSMVFGPNG
jgi:hypothetical protein